ncbi:Ig-like domain-containing protein [Geobacter sulfurreducens]|uniref:Ig-like domain-containing protein n=1 Tax=Geobacter sulfurreducens TaxID=35554 RepID=UPI003D700FA2
MKKLLKHTITLAATLALLVHGANVKADTWQQSLQNTFDIVETFDELQDWDSSGIAPSGTGPSQAWSSSYLPKKIDGSSSIWGYWNNKANSYEVSQVNGTFSKGQTVTSGGFTFVLSNKFESDGKIYFQFSSLNGALLSGDKIVGPTGTASVVGLPKFIAYQGNDYTWRGAGKTLVMNLGDNNNTSAMAGMGAQRLGVFFGDGITGKSGYKKINVFMMLRYRPAYFVGTAPDNFTWISVLKFIDLCSGFTSIDRWGTPSERALLATGTVDTAQMNTEYGMNYSLINVYGGGASQPDKLFFQEEYRIPKYADGIAPPYVLNKSYAATYPTARFDSFQANTDGTTKWFGIEIESDIGTIGKNDGSMTIWVYDQGGNVLFTGTKSGYNKLLYFDHYYNKVVLGGNRLSGATTTDINDGRYYVDDFIINENRIGPTYFQLLNSSPQGQDTTVPIVTISNLAQNQIISGLTSISVSASDNISVSKTELFLDGVLHSTDSASPYSFTVNTATLANGAHTLLAKAYDAAGNVGQSSSVSVTVSNVVADTQLPVAAIAAPSAGVTVSGTVQVSASATDNVGVSRVEFFENGTLRAAVNAAPYSYNWDTKATPNGNCTISAKAYDSANNVGQSAAVTVTVNNDLTAPAVALSAPANNATVSGTVAVNATATDSVGVSKVEFYVNGVLKATDTTNAYSYSWDTKTVANGSYTLTAKAYDTAGNVGQSSTVTVAVNNPVADTTVPVVSLSAPANNATVSGTVAVNATASDNVGVSKVEFYVNGALKSTDTTNAYSYSWDTKTVANGSYTLTAKAYDAAGNVGQSSTVTVAVNNPVADTTVPVVSLSAPANNATVSGTVAVNATASDNVGVSKVEFYVNGALKSTDTTNAYSYSWDTKTVANGSYTLTAKAYDAAGNVGQSSTVTVTVNNAVADTTVPVITLTAPANKATVSGTVAMTATATDNVGVSKVEFYVNNVLKSTDTTAPYVYNWDTRAVANGTYILTAKAYDAANNTGYSLVLSVTVDNDTAAPTVSVSAPANNTTVSGTVAVNATASDNVGVSKVEFYVNNVLKATDTTAPYSYSWDTTSVANGAYTLVAKAYDAAGNVGQSSSTSVTVNNVVIIKGDVDGDLAVTVNDALIILKAVNDSTLMTPTVKTLGDVAPLDPVTGKPVGDGKVDVTDVLMILRYTIGLVTW